ncbi:MAG: hypothetical protein ACRCZF_01860 [Gemmataceae bacterium]
MRAKVTLLFWMMFWTGAANAANPISESDAAMAAKARAALALLFAEPSYAEQHARALASERPLVVFVNEPRRWVPGCVTVRVPLLGEVRQGVIVGVPVGAELRRIDLPAHSDDDAIRTAAQRASTTGTALR